MNFLAMQPDVIDEAGRRLQAGGNQLQADWDRARSAIATYENGIGTGRLADAFRAGYAPASMQARANTDPFPNRVLGLGTATSISANRYVLTEAQVAELFRRLQAGG